MDNHNATELAYKKGVQDTLKKVGEMLGNEKTKFAEDFYIVYMIDVEKVLNKLGEAEL